MNPADPRERPPFDPRQHFAVTLHDHGPVTAWHPDARGELVPIQGRRRSMDVFVDGACEITGGLVLGADDHLVALQACGQCETWECNLAEGYAAEVFGLGPYVLWRHPDGRVFTFGADAYAAALGGSVDALPRSPDVAFWYDDPDLEAAYPCVGGAVLAVNDDTGPLAPLRAWPYGGAGDVRPVAPPRDAVEVRALNGLSASAWVDSRPRDDGRRAAYLPAVTGARVWCAGEAVDRVVEALVGGAPP